MFYQPEPKALLRQLVTSIESLGLSCPTSSYTIKKSLKLNLGGKWCPSLFLNEPELNKWFTLVHYFVFCRFFSVISSKCPSKRDEDSTSYSFISDSSVLSLHKLLWDHQEKIGTYLATRRWAMIRFVKIMADFWCICNEKRTLLSLVMIFSVTPIGFYFEQQNCCHCA